MNPGSYQVRRATVDDLEELRELWRESQLPVAELEKRFTEFQIVVDADEQLLGGLGLLVFGSQGKLHSESFRHPELEDELRPLLWDRLQILAHNHGLAKIWTLEQSPFWQRYAGFKTPSESDLSRLPVHFGDRQSRWVLLKFHEETPQADTVEDHLQWFREAQKVEISRMMRRADLLKKVATGVALVLFVLVLMGGLLLLRRQTHWFRR